MSQRSFKECPAIAKISQWSVNAHPVISMVATVTSKFWLSPKQSLNDHQGSDLATNTQQMINKWSKSAQGVLDDLIDLPMISQRSFNKCQICSPWRRDGWEINNHTRISHRKSFFIAFEWSLRDQGIFLNHPTISVLCK